MSTVQALALVRENVLLSVVAIFQDGDEIELPVTPQKWEKRKLMGEFIRKLLKANNMRVNSHKLAEANVYNIYYIDVEALTVERRLS